MNERDPRNPLSFGAMAVLGALGRQGDLGVGELAAQEQVRPPSMTRTLNSLAREGYVTRHENPHDGRQVLVSLTAKGHATLLADNRRRNEWLALKLRALSTEDRLLLRRASELMEGLASAD